MTEQELKQINAALGEARDRRARAQGTLDTIQAEWDRAGIQNAEEASERLAVLTESLEATEAQIAELSKELRELVDGHV